MADFKYLSVQEMDGRSDRLGIQFEHWKMTSMGSGIVKQRVMITSSESIVIEADADFSPGFSKRITIPSCNIGEFIRFLQEAEQFISEEKMIAKLMGKTL